ncbi:MAG: tandem-95 repeat protein [Planctomycetaceae bacterium]
MGQVTLRGSSSSRAISLGAENSSALSLTDAELDRIIAGLVQIGSSGSTGAISVVGNLSQANNLSLVNNVSASNPIGILFEAGVTMAADKDFSVTALGGPRPIETAINPFGTITAFVISTSGTGSLSMTANTGIVLRGGTTLSTENGDLSLSANLSGTDTGLYSGVFMNGGIVETRGTGDIFLTGRGSLGTASGSQVDGVRIIGTSVVRSISSTNLPDQGEIVIDGVGGRGVGIYVDPFGAPGDRIVSNGGNITLTGQGGNLGNGGIQADGVALANGARVVAANSAAVSITGTAGTGGTSRGVFMLSSTVQTAAGNITLIGQGGTTTTGSSNSGIEMTGGAILSTSGQVSLTGTGGSSTSSNYGIYTNSANIRSTNNTVALLGQGGDGAGSFALWLDNNTPIFSGVSVTAVGDSLNLPRSFFADQFSAPLVAIKPQTAGTRINLGGGDVLSGSPKTLGLGDEELDRIAAATLRIGDATSGTITVVNSGVTPPTNRALDVELISAGDIIFNASYGTVGFFSPGAPSRGNLLLSPGADGSVQPKFSGNDVVTQANTGGAFTTSFSAGSDLRINIDGLTAHTQYDRLTALGRVDLTGADLSLTGGFVSSVDHVFTIVSATNVAGTFNGLPENSFVLFNGRALRVNYTATTATLTDVGAPVTMIPQVFSLDENTTAVGTVQASPPQSPTETRTFSIAGSGADDGLFAITSSGVLSFIAPPDYEAPTDVGGTPADNVYEVAVRVVDGFGSAQVATMTVAVLPVNDNTPLITSPTTVTVAENSVSVQTLTATDADLPAQSLTFTLTGGADEARFTIVGGNQLQFVSAPDFEAPADADGDNVYEVTVQVSDGLGLSSVSTLSVEVSPVNDNAPLFTSAAAVSVAEDTTFVQTLTATDADLPAQSLTFTLAGGADESRFTIVNGNQLQFVSAPDFDTPADADGDNVYEVIARADDQLGLTTLQLLQLTVTNANDAPVATDDTVSTDEDRAVIIDVLGNDFDVDGDVLMVIAANDATYGDVTINPDGTITYTPDASFSGSDSFVYTISDGRGGESSATVNVAVQPRPDVQFAGRIFNDHNNDGVFNGADSGLAGVVVQLFDETDLTTPLETAVTDGDGRYRFVLSVEEGAYQIVAEQAAGLLDGRETAGVLGGTVDGLTDNQAIRDILVHSDTGDLVADGYDFAEIAASRLQGLVFEDGNNNGSVDFGELAIAGVSVRLTGTDDRGAVVDLVLQTDGQGIFEFVNLRPSDANGYTLTQTQPVDFADGLDSLGTVNGVVVGDNSVNDVFSGIVMTQPASDGINYNFAETSAGSSAVHAGQTATIGFWQNKNGQALIKSLNGGPQAQQLSNWLATTFPNMYGANAGTANLTGMTNAQVAEFYKVLFKRNGNNSGQSGPPKVDAQVFAVALAAYVTNQNLAGAVAAGYGFIVDSSGVGAATINVGSNGAAFGVPNATEVRVLDLLLAVNARTQRGILYDLNGDGDTNDPNEGLYRGMANDVFSLINEQGDIEG